MHKVRADGDNRKEFKCPYCPFTSILQYRYRTHLNIHTGMHDFVCNICSKSLSSSSTLRTHKQWFHSDKVFSCTQCNYQTKTKQKLTEHVKVQHQLKGFKPYKCAYCSFRCSTSNNTRKHIKQVHRGQPVTYERDDEILETARRARAAGFSMPIEELSKVVGDFNNISDFNNVTDFNNVGDFNNQAVVPEQSLEIVL